MSLIKVSKNATYLFASHFINAVFPLFYITYVTRIFSVTETAQLLFAISVSQFIIVFSDCGFSVSATKRVAQFSSERKSLGTYLVNITLIKLGVALFLYMAFIGVSLKFKISVLNYDLAFAIFLSVFGSCLINNWAYNGKNRFFLTSIAPAVMKILSVFGLLLMVTDSSDLVIAAALIAAVNVFTAVALLIPLLPVLSFSAIIGLRKRLILATFRQSWPVFLSSSASQLYVTATVPILSAWANPADVASYNIAERIARGVQSLLAPLTTAFFPFSSSLSKTDRRAFLKFNSAFGVSILSFGASLSILIFCQSENFIMLLAGANYLTSAGLLKILSPLPVFVAISNFLGVQYLLSLGFDKIFSNIVSICGVIGLIAIIFGSSIAGPLGLAISVSAIEGLVAVLFVVAAWKISRIGERKVC